MKKKITQLFLWSWIISLPVATSGGYWLYNTIDRFNEYSVRYRVDSGMSLGTIANYELTQLIQEVRVALFNLTTQQQTSLKKVHLLVPKPNLAKLEEQMPQSGFNYVKGGMVIDGKLRKAKFKYRGDTYYRWGWKKKSSRVKTSKAWLFEGIRSVNFLSPRSDEQLNNLLSYKLASLVGLIAPKSQLVRLYINGDDHGVHTLVEQIKEMTLRNAKLMPGDIYRGEMIEKDSFGPSFASLFETASVWDKVAINNHFAEDSFAPLENLIALLNHPDPDYRQQELSVLLDMEAWGRYALFETLTQSSHSDRLHNWRIYYDPWRQKIIPIVWDPMGWYDQLRGKPFELDPIPSPLMQVLFENGDFLRARHHAFTTFYNSGLDRQFLALVKESVSTMAREIKNDPLLLPQDPERVTTEMKRLESAISDNLGRVRDQLTLPHHPSELEVGYNQDHTLSLLIQGTIPVEGIELVYNQTIGITPEVSAHFSTSRGAQRVDLTGDLSLRGDTLHLDTVFLPETDFSLKPTGKTTLKRAPGYYQITIDGLPPGISLRKISVGKGGKMYKIEPVSNEAMTPIHFSRLKIPLAAHPLETTTVWSGVVAIEGVQTLVGSLHILPGTVVKMGEGATLIIEGKLTAEGSVTSPIQFLPATPEQPPWGAIVLKGEGANGSVFSHCQMGGGSGLKGDLFEYSGMLSIHHVKELTIHNCHFYDNHLVDDMVHAVYSEISFDNVSFENAKSDALDLDISSATINNSRFINSGNDAVDLMTTRATVLNTLFSGNGDKGISVGEGSHLLAINNRISNNEIGVQSKDRSTALLFNHTFTNNRIALHTYRKNWRYGVGGALFISKSIINQHGKGNPSSADKRSSLHLFDSTILGDLPKGKRVTLQAIDSGDQIEAREEALIPEGSQVDGEIERLLVAIPEAIIQQIDGKTRGAHGVVN